ncbi:MAG TPA: TonB-dependent receptor plug domain-containing protein, partial [Puia sp.]|nr:TonB-dependent receptor plug domain-containing protein [Puia sp.]
MRIIIRLAMFTVWCSFLVSVTLGQQPGCTITVTGHIFISDTARLDAAGASIKFSPQNIGTVTDSSGNFRVTGLCAGKYRVVISYEGFRTLDTLFYIRHDMALNFLLFSTAQELRSITITGEVIKRDQITTAIKTTLAGAELEATRGLSLGESLKSIAGVNSLQTGPSISKPVIHGVYSNRVLIMNNGVRQEGQNWGNDHAPEIDPFIATKVTVIKGAASIRYGSDAIGGAILLDPKELPTKPGIGGEVNLVGMSNGRTGVASGYLEGASGG